MFTGIIQATGKVVEVADNRLFLHVQANGWPDAIKVGESIAVNGCCLTVVPSPPRPPLPAGEGELSFDLSEETFRRTAFDSLRPDSRVNLERALRPMDRMGGHIVQGHVDGVGELISRQEVDGGEVFRFRVPEDGARYVIEKGSIALDGISLTVVEPDGPEFEVWVIPHTLSDTNLTDLGVGDQVNVEFDMIAKYLEKLSRRVD